MSVLLLHGMVLVVFTCQTCFSTWQGFEVWRGDAVAGVCKDWTAGSGEREGVSFKVDGGGGEEIYRSKRA